MKSIQYSMKSMNRNRMNQKLKNFVRRSSARILLCVGTGLMAMSLQAQLVTWQTPGIRHNDDYTVRVREVGGEWKDLYEYNVNVDMDRVQDASMVQFDMGSPVEVMVKKNPGHIHDV